MCVRKKCGRNEQCINTGAKSALRKLTGIGITLIACQIVGICFCLKYDKFYAISSVSKSLNFKYIKRRTATTMLMMRLMIFISFGYLFNNFPATQMATNAR